MPIEKPLRPLRPSHCDCPACQVTRLNGASCVRLPSRPITRCAAALAAGLHIHDTEPSALLPAGSLALVRADGVLVRSLPLDDATRLLGWRDGLLVFRDTTLAEAATEFNRYNARKLVVADDTAGALRVGGNFRWDNAEGFARLLERGFPVRAEYQAARIVLHSQ